VQERGSPVGQLKSWWTVVDGRPMYARVSAEPAPTGAPPLVLVHGLIVSSRYMVPTAQRLAPYYRVCVPDMPGYGRSVDPPQVLNVAELGRALARWLDAAGITRCVLLANSFGCQVAAELAVRQPERVERLILAGPTVDPHAHGAFRQIVHWLRDVPREPPSMALVLARDILDIGPRRAVRTFQCMLQDRIELKLPRIEAPTLVVRGARDSSVPQRWAEEATRLLPRARLAVIPGAAHTVNYNSSRRLALLVRAFLDDPLDEAANGTADSPLPASTRGWTG